jgi:hypothetical protein
MIQNHECDEPRITVKRDKFLANEFPSDKVMSLEGVYIELDKRNKETEVPIYIIYEHKNCWNVTCILQVIMFCDNYGKTLIHQASNNLASQELQNVKHWLWSLPSQQKEF